MEVYMLFFVALGVWNIYLTAKCIANDAKIEEVIREASLNKLRNT